MVHVHFRYFELTVTRNLGVKNFGRKKAAGRELPSCNTPRFIPQLLILIANTLVFREERIVSVLGRAAAAGLRLLRYAYIGAGGACRPAVSEDETTDCWALRALTLRCRTK